MIAHSVSSRSTDIPDDEGPKFRPVIVTEPPCVGADVTEVILGATSEKKKVETHKPE